MACNIRPSRGDERLVKASLVLHGAKEAENVGQVDGGGMRMVKEAKGPSPGRKTCRQCACGSIFIGRPSRWSSTAAANVVFAWARLPRSPLPRIVLGRTCISPRKFD